MEDADPGLQFKILAAAAVQQAADRIRSPGLGRLVVKVHIPLRKHSQITCPGRVVGSAILYKNGHVRTGQRWVEGEETQRFGHVGGGWAGLAKVSGQPLKGDKAITPKFMIYILRNRIYIQKHSGQFIWRS